MKTIQSINIEISHLLREYEKYEFLEDKRMSRKLRKTFFGLDWQRRYLESNPNPLFVENEIERIGKRLELIADELPTWYNQDGSIDAARTSKSRRDHNKLFEVRKLKEQLKNLKLIYNGDTK